jgi:hypothetical protein
MPARIWLFGTLIVGVVLAATKPALLIPWAIPGVPPPGPFG